MAKKMQALINLESDSNVADFLQGKDEDDTVDCALDRLLVEFGKEILAIVPGKVSTEVDARFSFDTQATIDKALHIIDVRCVQVLSQYLPLTLLSSTNRLALTSHAFSSRLLLPGRVSRLHTSSSRNTA